MKTTMKRNLLLTLVLVSLSALLAGVATAQNRFKPDTPREICIENTKETASESWEKRTILKIAPDSLLSYLQQYLDFCYNDSSITNVPKLPWTDGKKVWAGYRCNFYSWKHREPNFREWIFWMVQEKGATSR
jgi:hypothetical protein